MNFFDGSDAMECETCNGRGYVGVSEHEDARCRAAGCCSGMIECSNCQDGTAADVVFDGGPSLCLGCIAGGLGMAPRYGLRFTDAGRVWALLSQDGSKTQELPAITTWDDITERAPVYEYVPPKSPVNDACKTAVDLQVVSQ